MADGSLDSGELLGAQRGADGALNLHRYRSIVLGLCEKFLYYFGVFIINPPGCQGFFLVFWPVRTLGKVRSGLVVGFSLAPKQVSLVRFRSVSYLVIRVFTLVPSCLEKFKVWGYGHHELFIFYGRAEAL
jgi:hypothetical protein